MITRAIECESDCSCSGCKQRRRQRRQPHDICITPGCDRPYHSRGLCDTCRTQARRAIKRGETTWEELEELGLALPHVLWWNNAGSGVRWSKLHRALYAAREAVESAEGTSSEATGRLRLLSVESFTINQRMSLPLSFGVGVDVVAAPPFFDTLIVDRVVSSPHAEGALS